MWTYCRGNITLLSFIHKFDVMIELWNVFIALFIPQIPAQTSSRELRVLYVGYYISEDLESCCGWCAARYISVHTCSMA